MADITILIADDHQLMREGLVSMLAKEPGMKVVAEAETGRQAVQLYEELLPDIVVLDIGMPDLNGIDATRKIIGTNPEARIIALSMHTENRFVQEILKAGASGYVPKNSAFEELSKAIASVYEGRKYLSPTVTNAVLNDYLGQLKGGAKPTASLLTVREREVLQLVAEGKSSKEIAKIIEVSMNTVIRHRQNFMDKLGLRNIAELTRYAIREHLVDP